jgi:hypothetical protein
MWVQLASANDDEYANPGPATVEELVRSLDGDRLTDVFFYGPDRLAFLRSAAATMAGT